MKDSFHTENIWLPQKNHYLALSKLARASNFLEAG